MKHSSDDDDSDDSKDNKNDNAMGLDKNNDYKKVKNDDGEYDHSEYHPMMKMITIIILTH
jgi:hypothetical protein